jgi:hypothetical protein
MIGSELLTVLNYIKYFKIMHLIRYVCFIDSLDDLVEAMDIDNRRRFFIDVILKYDNRNVNLNRSILRNYSFCDKIVLDLIKNQTILTKERNCIVIFLIDLMPNVEKVDFLLNCLFCISKDLYQTKEYDILINLELGESDTINLSQKLLLNIINLNSDLNIDFINCLTKFLIEKKLSISPISVLRLSPIFEKEIFKLNYLLNEILCYLKIEKYDEGLFLSTLNMHYSGVNNLSKVIEKYCFLCKDNKNIYILSMVSSDIKDDEVLNLMIDNGYKNLNSFFFKCDFSRLRYKAPISITQNKAYMESILSDNICSFIEKINQSANKELTRLTSVLMKSGSVNWSFFYLSNFLRLININDVVRINILRSIDLKLFERIHYGTSLSNIVLGVILKKIGEEYSLKRVEILLKSYILDNGKQLEISKLSIEDIVLLNFKDILGKKPKDIEKVCSLIGMFIEKKYRPDESLGQDYIFNADSYVFKNKKFKELELYVPRTSHELIDVGQYMKNCLGESLMYESIVKKNRYIIFIKKGNRVKFCLSLNSIFEFIELKGIYNSEPNEELLDEIKRIKFFKYFLNY